MGLRHQSCSLARVGRTRWLEEGAGGISSGDRLLPDAGHDSPQLPGSLAEHQRRFGHLPWLLAGDRGVASPATEALAKQAGVNRVGLPRVGTGAPARVRHERQPWFRRGVRFRADIEGRISVLRRCSGLDRCREHGADGMGRWVGWGIVIAHRVTTARTVARRSAAPAARAS
jgi:hypothetical protein